MIVLIGAGGYFGSEFSRLLTKQGLDYCAITRDDKLTFESFTKFLHSRPQEIGRPVSIVINCAAYVDQRGVDYNEQHRALTLTDNLLLPMILTHACEATDTPLLHLSSGCLYQGDNDGRGWSEDDAPQLNVNTCGIYVASKMMAEKVVGQWAKSYICRVRLPFDGIDHPRNLLTKLQNFTKVSDETQSLTHRGDAVKAMLDLWQRNAAYGVYHCVSPGGVSYRKLCTTISLALYSGKKRFDLISPGEFDETLAATTKSRCVLNTTKLAKAGVTMRHVDKAIDDAILNWKPNV